MCSICVLHAFFLKSQHVDLRQLIPLWRPERHALAAGLEARWSEVGGGRRRHIENGSLPDPFSCFFLRRVKGHPDVVTVAL